MAALKWDFRIWQLFTGHTGWHTHLIKLDQVVIGVGRGWPQSGVTSDSPAADYSKLFEPVILVDIM